MGYENRSSEEPQQKVKVDSEMESGLLLRTAAAFYWGVARAAPARSRDHQEAANESRSVCSFSERIRSYIARYVALWQAVPTGVPRLGRIFASDEQERRERQADQCIADIDRRLRRYPRIQRQREVWRDDLLRALQGKARDCLGFPEAGLKLFFNQQALNATRQFIRDARAFDPAMSDDSVFQALRNVWVIHNLQLFLGSDLTLSSAAFGYSMLYPWTDNYLDDPQIPDCTKAAFGKWLGSRLAGERSPPPDAHAAQVSRLVGLVEGGFDRKDHPEVFLSLRAIHDAQMASLGQHKSDGAMEEQALLAITAGKGGTSVLADGYLVRGTLNEAEADFIFGYGVLLQLMDDLRDLRNDLTNRHETLFARHATHGLLDEITSRLWSFAQTVLWSSATFGGPKFKPLKTLIQENCKLLLLQSVAQNRHFYSRGFVRELEARSPFHFGYLRKRETTLAVERARIAEFMQRQHGLRSIADALD